MSSTNRGATRIAEDWYETPSSAIRPILNRLGPISPTRVLEPMAGRGAIVQELLIHWPRSQVTAIELDPGRYDTLALLPGLAERHNADFFEWQSGHYFDLAITNPAFDLAMPCIESCLAIAREVVMLLRLNFRGSLGRADFWKRHPADIYVLPRRPSFAASLKCAPVKKSGKKSCGWKHMLPLDAERPKVCPECGQAVHVTTTDSIEYCWAHWAPTSIGRIETLEIGE